MTAQSERLRRSNRHHSPTFALGWGEQASNVAVYVGSFCARFVIYLVLFVGFPTYCLTIDPFCCIAPARAAGARPFLLVQERTQRIRQREGLPLWNPPKVAAAGLLGAALRNDGSE